MRVVNGTLNGNPALDPWRSENYSLSAEWYMGEASMMYVATYDIEIESFTESSTVMIDEPDFRRRNSRPMGHLQRMYKVMVVV